MKYIFYFFLVFVLCNSILLPQSYTWDLKVSGSGLGHPVISDKNNDDIIYCGFNNRIHKSYNRGESFSLYGTVIPGATRIKTIILNPKDSLQVLAAIESSPQRVMKTTDGGLTWFSTGNFSFSYFGIPVTQDPSHPDTVYLMDGSIFKASYDFGSNWETVANVPTNGAPCDIEVFPDSSNIILVGDNGTGIFRSSNYGKNWQLVFSTSGEIPTIAMDKQIPGVAWATRWGGGGGFLKSTDYGKSWSPITFFNGKNMWGVDVSPNNSDFLVVGQYSGGKIYISNDNAQTWLETNISGSNYAIYVIDSVTVFSAQSNGLYKLNIPVPSSSNNIKLVFSIDINKALDFRTRKRIDTIANGVWLKGSLNQLGGNQGNWTFNDTLSGYLIRMNDNGSGYDSLAGDNIWTAEVVIPAGTPTGSFTYKYGISYPGVDSLFDGAGYLDNETEPDFLRSADFYDTDSVIVIPMDRWQTLAIPVISVMKNNITAVVNENDSTTRSMRIGNYLGQDTLYFHLVASSDSIITDEFGLPSNIFSDSLTDRSNKYFIEQSVTLTEIQQYFDSKEETEVYFYVFEGDSSFGKYNNIFSRRVIIPKGKNFKSSGQIDVSLLEGKFYAIGVSWGSTMQFVRGGMAPIETRFGYLLSGQAASASFPPADSASFQSIFTPIYLQKLSTTLPVDWLSFEEKSGFINSGLDKDVIINFNAVNKEAGDYDAVIHIASNDTANGLIKVSINLQVLEVVTGTIDENIITEYKLEQNYPNPFNPSTVINYHVKEEGMVTLKIFDLLGNLVATLVDEEKESGRYSIVFDAEKIRNGLASGIYLYRFTVNDYSDVKKLMLLK